MPRTSTALRLIAAATLLLASACDRNAPPAADAQQPDAAAAPATTPATADPGTAPSFDAPPALPAAESHASLQLVNNSGTIHYSGAVDSEVTRQAIAEALATAYGERDLSGDLRVDERLQAPPWLGNLPLLLPAFSMQGAALAFNGERIELTGHASPADRAALRDSVQALYPDARLTGLFQGIGADAPLDDASRALDALAAGGSGPALVSALNGAPFRFEANSARIDPGSLDLISRAASAIRAAPEGTRIEITGPVIESTEHLDGGQLSRQRAEAMKVQLILNGVSPAAITTLAADGSDPAHASADGLRFRLVE